MTYPDDEDRPGPLLHKSPVLRCADPTREEDDGTVWLWLDGRRPVAALCLFLVRGQWNYEHVSLSGEAVEVTGRPWWTWRPAASERTWVALEGSVPEAAAARDRMVKDLAGKFVASEVRRGEPYPLRLMPRPVFKYSDPEADVVEGAMFVFAYGTNPEILVQIEAREADGKRSWHASFARLSAAEISVKLGENEVWNVPAMTADDPRQDYFSAHGKDPLD
jgi:hypothetical protein